jgi:hypothetical protein
MSGSAGGGSAYTQSANSLKNAGTVTGQAMHYAPMQVGAGQLASTDMGQYMNPYTSNVIDTSMGDLNRARSMAMNDVGAQATKAGAFGGSRHGVAEGVTNTGFANQAASMAAGLRNQGFQNAQGAAQFDIGNRLNAGLANQNAGLQGAQFRLGAAGQLAGMAGQGFDMANTVNGMQSGYGTQQQQNNQNLINSIIGQWQGFTGAPGTSLGMGSTALGSVPYGQTQSTSQSPGLLNIASLFMGL